MAATPADERAAASSETPDIPTPIEQVEGAYPTWVSLLALAAVVALIPLTIFYGRAVSPWIVPGLMVGLLGFGVLRGVRVYEAFVDGAKDGFQVAVRIIPHLVAILVAVGMFRASGAMELLIEPLGSLTRLVGLPPEALPMALLRPLSGLVPTGYSQSILSDPATGPTHMSAISEHISRFNGNDVLRACRLFRRGGNSPKSGMRWPLV